MARDAWKLGSLNVMDLVDLRNQVERALNERISSEQVELRARIDELGALQGAEFVDAGAKLDLFAADPLVEGAFDLVTQVDEVHHIETAQFPCITSHLVLREVECAATY